MRQSDGLVEVRGLQYEVAGGGEILLNVFLSGGMDDVTLDSVVLSPHTEAVLAVDIVTELLPVSI